MLLLALAAAACGRSPAREACSPEPGFDPASALKVTGSFPEPVLDRTRTKQAIRELGGPAATTPDTPGLTIADYAFWTHQDTTDLPLGGGASCVWLESLKVDVSYSSVTVFVASAYDEASCPYAITLKHELEHVDTHRRAHAEAKAALEEALRKDASLPTRARPLRAAGPAEGRRRIDELVEAVVAPVRESFKATIVREAALLDSPDSYRAYQAGCPSW